jgi:hypothetical protein
MKTKEIIAAVFCFVILHSPCLRAATTIDVANHYAYAANLGWLDWRGDTANGAVIGDYVCSGSIYSANVGWINLGSGTPVNQVRYQNLTANDFGVNHDGFGNLRGYAYGANIGWINFENTGAPKVDLATGKLSGYIYSANCGWISLSNSFAFVETDSFDPGALAPNGLPIAWLISNFGTTNVTASADADGDGMSNLQEYLAGTSPTNSASNLRITSQTFAAGGTSATLQWTSVSNRFYHIERSVNLALPGWGESVLGSITPDAGAFTSRGFADTNAAIHFYRIRAARPLTP